METPVGEPWNEVEFVFNEETITKTFGLCNVDCMYSTQTIAKISAGDHGRKHSCFKGYMQGEEPCFSIDNNLYIISENYYELKLLLRTNSDIDCFAISGDFLLIGESNGDLKLIFIPTAQTILSKSLSGSRFRALSFAPTKNGIVDAYILCTNNFLKISDVDLDGLGRALKENDLTLASNIRNQMQIAILNDKFLDKFLITHCTTFLDAYQNFSMMLTGSGPSVLKILCPDSPDEIRVLDDDLFNGAFLLKADFVNDGRYIIALDSENFLHLLCTQTLILLKSWTDTPVANFICWESVINGVKSEEMNDCKLVILTHSRDADSVLYLLNFIDFEQPCLVNDCEIVYKTVLSGNCCFLQMPPYQETLFLLEGIKGKLDSPNTNYVTSLNVKCLQEMQPDTKLSRFIKKRKFKEAEEFANLFRLDLQVVYWSQINCILESFMPDKLKNLPNDEVDILEADLFKCIKLVNDCTQLVSSCRNIVMPSIEMYKKFLNAVKDKVGENETQIAELNSIYHRLHTFELNFNAEEFCSGWQSFLCCDIAREFFKYLQENKEELAWNLWLRYECEIIQDANIEQLLDVVGMRLNCSRFFDNVLPNLLLLVPESLGTIIIWLIAYCKNLELCAKEEWPKNALDFLEKAIEIIEVSRITFHIRNWNSHSIENIISQMYQFQTELKDLLILWRDYDCRISYSNFTQDDKTALGSQLLEDIFDNAQLPAFVSCYLSSFSMRFELSTDEILFDYLQKILSWMSAGSWEHHYITDRITTVTNMIRNEEYLCEAILSIMSSAETPWNETVEKLVKMSQQLNSNLLLKINEGIRFSNIKGILSRYGLKDFNLSNEKLMMRITQYIVMQDKSYTLLDALEIAKLCGGLLDETDVFILKLRHLVGDGQEDDFIAILKNIPINLLPSCCHRFVQTVISLINANKELCYSGNVEEEVQYLNAALAFIKFTTIRNTDEQLEKLQETFERIIPLKDEFAVHITFNQLENPTYCSVVFSQNAENLLAVDESDPCVTLNSLYRLGKLLTLRFEAVTRNLLETSIGSGDRVNLTVHVLKHIILELPHINIKQLLVNISEFLKVLYKQKLPSGKLEQIVVAVDEVLTAALIYCNSDEITACCVTKKWISLLIRSLSVQDLSTLNDWPYNAFYQDLGFINLDIDQTVSNSILEIITYFRMDEMALGADALSWGIEVCRHLQCSDALLFALDVISAVSMNKYNGLVEAKTAENIALTRKDLMTKLYQCVLMQKPLDQYLGANLSLYFSPKYIKKTLTDVLKNFNYDYEHAANIARLGSSVFKYLHIVDGELTFTQLQNQLFWKRKFQELKIDINHLGFMELETTFDWQTCTREVASHPDVTIDLLLEFCKAFNGCENNALIYHLEHLFTAYDNLNALTIKPSTMFTNSFPSDFTRIVERVIELSSNKLRLLKKMECILEKICPYNYEKISIILFQMISLAYKVDPNSVDAIQEKINRIQFLFDYVRVHPPSETEIETIKKWNCESLSKIRLPFHPFVNDNPWKVITAELNLKTVDVWHCAAPLFQLSCGDELLAIAVQNEINQFISTKKTSNDMIQIQMVRNVKMDQIFKTIQQIKNATVAISCANWVMANIPLSPEKVRAARFTVEIAENFANETKEKKFSDYCKKLKEYYKRVSIERILEKYKLNNSETSNLLPTPGNLIVNLYDNCGNNAQVYNAVEEICEVLEINHHQRVMILLDKWLTGSNNVGGMCLLVNDVDKQEKEDIKKAIYVLNRLPKEESILFLLNKIVQEEPCKSYAYRYHALQCLTAIADSSDIKNFSKNSITDVRQYSLAFHYLSQIEQLNLRVPLKTFLNSNKEKLASAIWNKNKRTAKLIDLIANFCLDYEVKNAKIFEEILNEQVSQKMVKETERFLSANSVMTLLRESNSWITAWQFILIWPFQNGRDVTDKEMAKGFVPVAEKLYKCPVHFSPEYLSKLCEEFFKVKLPAVGVGCLFHITDNIQQADALAVYSTNNNLRAIRDNLLWTEEENIIFPQFLSVLNFLMKHAQKGFYELFIDTPFQDSLVTHIAHNSSIRGLLQCLSKLERWCDCKKLLQVYLQKYPNEEISKLCVELPIQELVKKFIQELIPFNEA